MPERALVDWGSEDLLPQGRQIDDWTAGDDLDFTVRKRRRITPRTTEHRPATSEHPVQRTRAPQRTVVDAPPVADARPRADVVPVDDLEQVSVASGDRRTVAITGRPELQPAPRLREVQPRRRPARSPVDQAVSRPDRIALWAVGLGFLLILIAALSGGA